MPVNIFRSFWVGKYTAVLALGSLLIASCSKTDAVKQDKEYVQYFKASVNGKLMVVENTMLKDRDKLSGQWTGVGNMAGSETELYTINAILRDDADVSQSAKLRLQIENIKVDTFLINNATKIYSPVKGSYFRLAKGDVYYVPSNMAKPFNVRISRYELPAGSSVPIVGGELNGVLYNEQNNQDSIVVKDGSFEVRF